MAVIILTPGRRGLISHTYQWHLMAAKELNINPPPASMSFYSCVVTPTDQKAISIFMYFFFFTSKKLYYFTSVGQKIWISEKFFLLENFYHQFKILSRLRGFGCCKNRLSLNNWHPARRPMILVATGKKQMYQTKTNKHLTLVLHKLSTKETHTSLKIIA